MELVILFTLIGILVGLLIASLIWGIKYSYLKDDYKSSLSQQIIQTRMEINRTQMLKNAVNVLNILRRQYRRLLDDLKRTAHDDSMQNLITEYEQTYNSVLYFLEITNDEPDKVGYRDWIDKQIESSERIKSDLLKEYKLLTGIDYQEDTNEPNEQ